MTSLQGILPSQTIRALVDQGVIAAAAPVADDQIQPASLDLRLGSVAHRVRASFLPGPDAAVAARLESLTLHRIDLSQGAVLETGCVYIVPLQETLRLPPDIAGAANPKSSTGRLDVFTRVITDRARTFDNIAPGYRGQLYLEISPRTFSVLVRAGTRLSQLRFRRGSAELDDGDLAALHVREALVDTAEPVFAGGLCLSVDLNGTDNNHLIGYRARRHADLIDMDKRQGYPVDAFWEPIDRDALMLAKEKGRLILDPNEFYILVSAEAVHVPPGYAAEMVPFDPLMGEFRVHYAGFFDPGFGHRQSGGAGSRAVLEVRSHEVPFIIEHGQIVGRLVYEALTEVPARLYGELGSHYQAQGLKLSKHFRDR